MDTFVNVRCAKCSLPSEKGVNAKTMSGAIKKATIECAGVVMGTDGVPHFTECAPQQY